MNVSAIPIHAENLEFSYVPDTPVLRGVSLTGQAGKFVCLLGPNGSGKTTFLRCILGQQKPSSGRILLEGKPLDQYSIRQRALKMGYVAQNPVSAFAFTVEEIVLMGRLAHTGMLGLGGRKDKAIAHAALEMTGADQFSHRTLGELSGGESQCVMIARAIAQQPSVLLLDEPTSQLDVRNQLKIYRMMQRLAHDWSMAVVCVSHDINLAGRFADELILMKKGRVVASGPPVEVIQEDVLAQTYGVKVELLTSTNVSVPTVCILKELES